MGKMLTFTDRLAGPSYTGPALQWFSWAGPKFPIVLATAQLQLIIVNSFDEPSHSSTTCLTNPE